MKNFTCDPVTRSELGAISNKLAWAGAAEAALGATRRVRCKRDPAPNAPDAWSTGTEFRNVGSFGAFSTLGGTITRIGQIRGATIQTGADIFTGTVVCRIEGNGRWIQGTMGPSAAAQRAAGVPAGSEQEYDFEVDGNFTSSNGFGVKSSFTISGPRFLASGVGTGAPAKGDSMPHTIEVWNWTNPANPGLAGSTTLDLRIDDFVYEDPEMAAEVGDVAVYQSSGVASLAEFDFAPTLLVMDGHNNESGAAPRWEMIIASAVSRTRSTWTTYPGMDTFNPSQHVTIPPAFKILVKDKSGAILKTVAMHDGRPINGKRAMQGGWTETSPMEPNYNVGMQLPVWSGPPKMSSKSKKWFPGLDDNALRPSRAHLHYTAIAVEPLITGGYQGNSYNGLHTMWAQLQWPMPRAHQDPQPRDPFGVIDSQFNRSGSSSEFGAYMDGWDYEPGSFSGHNWYTGPGGPRFDRGPIPSVPAMFGSVPDGFRPQGNVSWKNMMYGWSLAYSNHSNHWVSDPRTLQLAKDNTELLYEWDTAGNYYGDYGQNGPKVVDVRGGMREGEGPQHKDKNGQFFWMGWARDGLHSYSSSGWAALLLNSPMFAIQSKWDTFWQLKRGGGVGRSDYMVRSQAWLWLHYALSWKLASKHRLGIQRELLEKLLRDHLEYLHDDIVVPVFERNEVSPFADGLRIMGQPVQNGNSWGTQGGMLGMYMANVLALWKQTGLWSRMYGMSLKCKKTLDTQMRNIDKYVFDYTLDTSMEGQLTVEGLDPNNIKPWAQQMPKRGLMDAYRNEDGSVKWGDMTVGLHSLGNWVYVRKYYFPEFPHPRLDDAKAKWDSMFAAVAANVAAAPNNDEKRDRDHSYGYPGVSNWRAPEPGLLGPA